MQRLVLYLVLPPILVFFVAQLMVLVGMNQIYPEGYPDPFTPFESMMPGQWVMASGTLPCEPDVTPGNVVTIFCDIDPTDGHFVSVASSVYNGSFVETWFNAKNLLVGDVIRHWGRPDLVVRFNHRSFYVLWKDQGLIGIIHPVVPAERFSYMLPVEQFAIGLESRNLP